MIVLKNTSKVLVVFLLTFINSRLLAQSQPMPVEPRTLMKTVTPMAADLATLGRYAMQPPNLSNGLVNQTIPLLDIQENGINYPINLFYNYSGFRVKEEASSVGLGWGITEGSIIRIVKHVNDENTQLLKKFEQFGDYPTEERGFGYVDPNNWSHPQYSGAEYSLTANRLFYKFYDAQPDVYIFSFGPYNGKFFWLNGKAIQLEHSDIVIEKVLDTQLGQEVFILTTPDAMQYTFKVSDFVEITPQEGTKMTVCPTCMPWTYTIDEPYATAWKLIEIKNRNTKAKINLTYGQNVTLQEKNADQVSSVTFVKTLVPNGYENYVSWGFKKEETQFNTITTSSYLKEITSDNYKITFITKPRLDGGESRIEEIKIYEKSNLINPIRTIKFVQEYFGNTNDSMTCWLKLKKVLMDGVEGTNEYEFSYLDLPYIPYGMYKNGISIDHWGYFNSQGNGSLIEFTPGVQAAMAAYYLDQSSVGISWGHRAADFQYSKMFALEKITYPTKGYTKMNYESANGKGIRVASQEDFDGEKSMFRYYNYGGTSSYLEVPVYEFNEYFTYECCSPNYPASYVATFLSSHIEGDFFNDTENFYPVVTEYLGTPDGQGGKTVHTFEKFYGYGNKVVETEKTDYEYGNANFIHKEKNFYTPQVLKTVYYWKIPELNSTAVPGGSCSYDWGGAYRPSTGPSDPLLPTGFTYLLGNFNLYLNNTPTIWLKLDSTAQIDNNGIKSVKKYFYNNVDAVTGLPKTTNIIRTEEKLSNGKIKTTQFYYAGDTDPDNAPAILGIPQMWDTNNYHYNYSAPVLKRKDFINNLLVSKESNEYSYDAIGNYIIRTASRFLPNGKESGGENWSFTYDENVNLVKVNREGAGASSFFWGYNHMFPIIKGENVDYATLKSAVLLSTNNIEQLLLDIGDLKTASQRALWKSFNAQLRSHLPAKASVITYSHKHLRGITSETDAKGMTSYYEYDDFQRLKNIKDQNGNIIKNFKYNYKP